MKDEIYLIGGMHCAACAASVEKVTKRLPGMESAEVNLMTEKLSVRYDETQVSPEQIIAKIEKAGFTASVYVESDSAEKKAEQRPLKLVVMLVLAAALMYVSMGHMAGITSAFLTPSGNPYVFALTQLCLALPIMILGRNFYISGFKALFHLNPDMNTLVALSSTASFVFSLVRTACIPFDATAAEGLFFESGATVVALVSVGKYLEARSKNKTKEAIDRLRALAPEEALRVNEDGSTGRVPVAKLYLGDTILIKKGDRIPVDAEIISGTGSADESMLTGESLPVEKNSGDTVSAGSVLSDGAVYAKVTAIGHDTLLYSVIRFVEDAQTKKAPVARIADKVAGVFVPTVCGIALLSAVIWLIAGKDIAFALRIFTSVLVIACPCAMGLATPTAIMAGTGLGAREGILVRSGVALENLSKTTAAVFDKTGTVTCGVLSVSSVSACGGFSEEDILGYAGALEKLSSHPIATAVSSCCEERGVAARNVTDFTNIAGQGLAGTVSGHEVKVGKRAFCGPCNDDEDTVGITVYISVDGSYGGKITLSDTVRPEARDVIAALRKNNIKCLLLTGDNRRNAEKVAARAGFDGVYADVLPEEKAHVIEKLQSEGHRVLMCGDGINDAPALTVADTGVAVRSGTDIAMDCADVVLMNDSLWGVTEAVVLGRKTLRNIKQNLFWAFCYNTLAIPLAAGALYPATGLLLSPMIGGLCMSLSSLFVVTNALRLGKAKLK